MAASHSLLTCLHASLSSRSTTLTAPSTLSPVTDATSALTEYVHFSIFNVADTAFNDCALSPIARSAPDRWLFCCGVPSTKLQQASKC